MFNLFMHFHFFQWFGSYCGRYPLRVFLLNFLVVIPILSYFLFYQITLVTDVRRGYAHKNGRSTQEMNSFGEFYDVTPHNMELVFILVEAKHPQIEPKLKLTSELINEVARLDDFMQNLSVVMDLKSTTDRQKTLNFTSLQGARGDINYIFKAFKWAMNMQDDYLNSNTTKDSSIHLSFPNSRIYGHNFSIAGHFFHPKMRNSSSEEFSTEIDTIEGITLWYILEVDGPKMRKYLQQLELQMYDLASANNFSDQFNFHFYGDELANYEMLRGGFGAVKLLVVGLLLLILFILYTLKNFHWKQKLILVTAALCSPLMAIANSFAILGWLGYDVNAIMCIMPFLILGIGVDDAFLLLHAYRKWSLKKSKIDVCMGEVIQEIGPSISITSLTNMLAFTIGIFSPAPQLSVFCLSTTIAVFLDYVFEFTLFVPSIVFADQLVSHEYRLDSDSKLAQKTTNYWTTYARFILSKFGRLVCFLVLLFLYVFAYFGLQKMEVTFDPQKTFPEDSHLAGSLPVIEHMMEEYAPLTFIVNRPPNISNEVELGEFFTMIEEMESLPDAHKSERTELWLRKYLAYDFSRSGISDYRNYTPSYARVPRYLKDNLLDDKYIVKYHLDSNGNVEVDKFAFVLICYGKENEFCKDILGKRNWHQRADFVAQVRNIVDRYGSFRVTVFDYDATIYDLILTVEEEMLKAVLVTLACMTIVCFFIIPSVKQTGIAILSVLSISYTLLGALGWWNLDLDPVTMINVLMAIGFSVDFSAHICYHFYMMKPSQRNNPLFAFQSSSSLHDINQILNSVGKPMLEAAGSTLISMIPLFFLSIYIITAFAKTVVCVCVLGTIHGLFIVPVFLSWKFSNPSQKVVLKHGINEVKQPSNETLLESLPESV